MRKVRYFLSTTAVIVMSLLLYSCGLDCPPGYRGSNCDIEKTPTKVTITKIVVTNFAILDPSQLQWDLTDGADIYPVITGENTANVVWKAAVFYQNATPGVPYSFTPDITLDLIYPEMYYTCMLVDSDGNSIFNNDDLMGTAVFKPYNAGDGFPEIIYLSNLDMQVELHVKYTW
jgi:hypothetical protein